MPWPGFEPTTFLPWGNKADNCSTVQSETIMRLIFPIKLLMCWQLWLSPKSQESLTLLQLLHITIQYKIQTTAALRRNRKVAHGNKILFSCATFNMRRDIELNADRRKPEGKLHLVLWLPSNRSNTFHWIQSYVMVIMKLKRLTFTWKPIFPVNECWLGDIKVGISDRGTWFPAVFFLFIWLILCWALQNKKKLE